MDLLKCPECGKEIEKDSFYCDQCGKELKICPVGHGFRKGKKCGQCGADLIEAKSASNGQTPFADVKPAATQPKSMPSPTLEPEKIVRPVAASAEPKSLFSNTLNARLELRDGAVIGRGTGDFIHVFGTQGYVSGTHARMQRNPSGVWEIVDLYSSNGTFLNGQRLIPNQPATIKIGDTVAFYDLKFTVSEN